MNLSNELENLARSAPPAADPDVIVRLARGRRARRRIVVPAAAVLAALVIILPSWYWFEGQEPDVSGIPVTLSFTVEGSVDPAVLEHTRLVLVERAKAMRLGSPQAFIMGDHTIVLEVFTRAEVRPEVFTVPGKLRLHKVLRSVPFEGVTTASPSQGVPAMTLAELVAKLGDAYTTAAGLRAPAPLSEGLWAFAELTPAEVALLPASIQFNVPTVTCGQLNKRPPATGAPDNAEFTVCDGYSKLLLGPARLTGADISDTMVESEPGVDFNVVSLRLTPAGNPKWTELIRVAYHNTGRECDESAVGDEQRCRVAFVVDDRVLSTPEILAESVQPIIVGALTKAEAGDLAVQIGPRELPAGVVLKLR